MSGVIESYIEIILRERFWSWSVIGIVYLIIAFVMRGWFLNPMIQKAKELPPKYYHDIKHAYLKNSFWGWFFFFLPLVFFTLVWNWSYREPLYGRSLALLILGIFCYVWSVMLHLKAFGNGATSTLKRVIDEREMRAAIKNP